MIKLEYMCDCFVESLNIIVALIHFILYPLDYKN